MDTKSILNLVFFIGLVLLWIAYLVEAFRQSTGQGVLVLLLPGYVFYFAYVRSQYGRPMRLALPCLAALFVAT